MHAETYEHVECVVVDDEGSFDPSQAPQGRPPRLIRSDGRGIGHARNVGLAAARGELVIFLDDDDVALPNRISTLTAAMTRHHADVSFGMTRRAGAGSSISLPVVPTHTLSAGPIGFCDLLTCAPHVNAVLARTSALRSAGGFDAEASHFDDWSAWLRLADRNLAICSVPDVVAEWRIHGTGLSAEVIHLGVMKTRILALFARLEAGLSPEGARGIAMARGAVAAAEVLTYDDYARVMAATRDALHDCGRCLGRRLQQHHQPSLAPEAGRGSASPQL